MLRIDHIQIAAPAGCEAAARRFYGELLGLREVPKTGATVATGGGQRRERRGSQSSPGTMR